MSEVRWVALAEVTRPHGVRGEVRLKMYNSDSDLLPSQNEVLVRQGTGPERMMTIEWARGADAGHLLAKIRGIDDRDQAEKLRGAALCVRRDAFPPLEEGEFYVCDVIGARLVGPNGDLGWVTDLVSYPTADALVVRIENGDQKTIEIPLIDEFIDRVDADRKQVTLRVAALDFVSGLAVKRPDAD
jgi:16S rRNA processing protein RimM